MDARALLRAAKGAAKVSEGNGPATTGAITDRFASYNVKTGALRCTACSYMTIKHDNLWTSHIASKSHKQNASAILAKEREEEEKRRRREEAEEEQERQQQASAGEKRKAAQDDDDVTAEAEDSKKLKTGSADPAAEAEWAAFQKEVLAGASTASGEDYQKFAAATIEAAPVLRKPVSAEDEEEAQPSAPKEPEKTQEELKEERRKQQEQDEREEIMQRYEDEVRIQQEGDERVAALKSRLERIRNASKGKAKG